MRGDVGRAAGCAGRRDHLAAHRSVAARQVGAARRGERRGRAALQARARSMACVARGFPLPALSAEPRHMRLQRATSCDTDLVTSCLQICSYLHLKFSHL